MVYRNTDRIPSPLVGVVLGEKRGVSSGDHLRFFDVLLQDGRVMLITDHYLTRV